MSGLEKLQRAKEQAAFELERAQASGGVSPNQLRWMEDVAYANGKPDKAGPAHAYIWWPDQGPPSGCVDFEKGGGHILGIEETRDLLKRGFIAHRRCCASMGDPLECECDSAPAYLTDKGRALIPSPHPDSKENN